MARGLMLLALLYSLVQRYVALHELNISCIVLYLMDSAMHVKKQKDKKGGDVL